jgi:L-ribulose-5-phosphate 4-epimerase
VPVVRALTPQEVDADYEHFTGVAIVERLRELNLDPLEMPAVLQLHHAPFTFGKNAMDSLNNSIALEMCAQMAMGSFALNPAASSIPGHILEKHHLRKHGPNAYYGQK